jgi:hypothetical protein
MPVFSNYKMSHGLQTVQCYLVHHNCISLLYPVLLMWWFPMPDWQHITSASAMVSIIHSLTNVVPSLFCSHYLSFLIYCQVFPLFLTSSRSSLSSWCLPAAGCTTLFLTVPQVSFLHVLILIHFPVFLPHAFFFNGQPTVITSLVTVINKFWIWASLKISCPLLGLFLLLFIRICIPCLKLVSI